MLHQSRVRRKLSSALKKRELQYQGTEEDLPRPYTGRVNDEVRETRFEQVRIAAAHRWTFNNLALLLYLPSPACSPSYRSGCRPRCYHHGYPAAYCLRRGCLLRLLPPLLAIVVRLLRRTAIAHAARLLHRADHYPWCTPALLLLANDAATLAVRPLRRE